MEEKIRIGRRERGGGRRRTTRRTRTRIKTKTKTRIPTLRLNKAVTFEKEVIFQIR